MNNIFIIAANNALCDSDKWRTEKTTGIKKHGSRTTAHAVKENCAVMMW